MPQVGWQGAALRCSPQPALVRPQRLRVQCTAAPEPNDAERPSSSKGKSFSGDRRRKGRPAHLRSPDDSPLRDGNRDRLMGLLTERAAKTLAYYLVETNLNVHHWINRFIKDNPIPRDGNWDDVSGDTFLRTLLAMPIEEAMPLGRDPVFHNTSASDVDPRSIAQRIMEIRAQLAAEFIQDLGQVTEENKLLQLETLKASLISTEDAIADGSAAARQAATSSSSSSGTQSPGANRRSEEAADAARLKSKKSKKSVLPSQPTPSNWRLRLEVEAQVRGNEDDDIVPGLESAASSIPDSVQTGIISPSYTRPAGVPPPVAPTAGAPQAPVEPAGVQPLHPEVAEMLPLIRASPDALTPDVAQMLSSLAVMSNGQLHPDIRDALQFAVDAGARLHPEMAELLTGDTGKGKGTGEKTEAAASSMLPPPASADMPLVTGGGGAGGGAVTRGGAKGVTSAPSTGPGMAPLGQYGKPPVAPASAAAAAAAAAGTVPQVVDAAQLEEEEEVDSITALQNDACPNSDDE